MAGGGASSKSSNASRLRKRVEVESSPDLSSSPSVLKRAKNGSAFAKCEECNKDVPVALITFHNCSLDAKIKMDLETLSVEMPSEPKKKPSGEKRKARSGEPKAKKEKKAKNGNTTKRPLTAFFLFMTDFRKSFKESNPDNKKGSEVAKEGGLKWKSMTDEEKQVYIDKAADLKAEYDNTNQNGDVGNEENGGNASEKEVDEKEAEEEDEVEDEKEVDDEEKETTKEDEIEDDE